MGHNQQILDVRKNGAFIFNDALLIDYRQQKLPDLLKELVDLRSRLQHTVHHALKGDDRLLGQEKANVTNLLQGMIRTLTSLYLRLADVTHPGSYPEVSEGKDGFLIKGKMNTAEVTVQFSIEAWLRDYLETASEKLVESFRRAAADHKFTVEEKADLVGQIGQILVQTIQAFYLMRTGAVFK